MNAKIKRHFNKHRRKYFVLGIFLIWFAFALPNPLFKSSYTTILLDKNKQLLGAKIAKDGQWRFPENDSVPYKFQQAIINFEDAYFYKHPGVNPVSLTKALWQDIKAGKIVRGGSTLTMQVIRMSRGNRSRNVYQKLMEIILAMRLELSYSKDEILSLYASHAPFGGNVVGLEAASWRYYGRPPHKLSWGETATLAVLPNAPSLIYPGKNHQILLKKRNRLLDKLYKEKIIDSITCILSKEEELPQKPKNLPRLAPHLLERAVQEGKQGKRIYATLDKNLQAEVNRIAQRHHRYLEANKINNLAILVTEVETGNVLAYVGNAIQKGDKGNDVDMITASRSTGSLIKPFLYAFALKDGLILPQTLLNDTPTQIAGYHPKNFNKSYDGAVPADAALARSLNIPAVRLLRHYGLSKFYDKLQDLKLGTINKGANHYGLTLILGGAEIRLWDAVGVYGSMARVLNRYNNGGMYSPNDYFMPNYMQKDHSCKIFVDDDIFGASNIWFVFKALSDKDRPVEGGDWNSYKSAQKIAWKTGTSFGFRDAWSVGVNPKYVVGVWVGNASGEGRPGLTGTQMAAPIMFDVFKILTKSKWFDLPLEDIVEAKICTKSGNLASVNCEEVRSEYIQKNGERSEVCSYHSLVHLNKEGNKRVNSSCYKVSDMQTKKWFVLPPVQAYYYKKVNPAYKDLPPWEENCRVNTEHNIGLIYPKAGAQIFIPKDFNNVRQKIVFKAVHQNRKAVIYWHLDEKFLGTTKGQHKITIFVKKGMHKLTLMDDKGEILQRNFEVVSQ
jgi:penicillin-binding protein 1C